MTNDVALLRLIAQRIAGPRAPGPADAVALLTAAQGQELTGALLSLALRSASGDRREVESGLTSGAVVRSWPMRGTLHLVAAGDLPWLLDLLGPRALARATPRRRQLGITDADMEQARHVAVTALSGGAGLRRAELLAALAGAGVDVTGQRGAHLLGYLAQSGTVCLGPLAGREQLFVLLDDWIPTPRRLHRDLHREEALAELALRFFRGHGPATLADLVRWAGLTTTDARAGLATVRDRVACMDVEGVEHFLDPATPDLLADHRQEARGTFLLPGFDEYVLGYADRSAVLDPEFADRIVPGGNGVFRPTVVHDGRIVGTWGWTGRGAKRSVTATPFTTFPDDVVAAISELAAVLD